MDKHLNRGVKAVIDDYPEVGTILDDFGVGCTNCVIGTCLLRDVVGIHNLGPNTEAELMYQIEKAIYPDRDVQKPELSGAPEDENRELTYSPPVQMLVDEHTVIKRWLALIPAVTDALETRPDEAWGWVEQGVALIREYADRYHHAKEEDILFGYADQDSEIIQAMHEEHEIGRGHVQEVLTAIADRDAAKATTHLLAYRELLSEHIRKEDEILYPWLDRGLSVTQVGEMYSKFGAVDNEATTDPEKHIEFIENLEGILA
ncbi:MAG: hypothetical protein FH749_02295 [Firmicutes bacterium]|nr:hypothetical protein [Bacillota bacterium]